MSYIDRVGHSVPRAGAPPETAPPPPPSHPVLSPNQKAITVPQGSYKTVTDALEGCH